MAIEDLGGTNSGAMATIVAGDPMSRSMGQYGKGHSFNLNPAPVNAADGAGTKGGTGAVRDSKGGLKPHDKLGGLGAGPNGSYGSPRDYGASGDNS